MSTQTNEDLQKPQITTLRLPVFCVENKPFIFIKVMNHSEKYRISVNPEFLKNYNLNFKILRDQSLNNFMSGLKPHLRNIIKRGNHYIEDDTFTSVSIFLKLPEKDKFPIQKHTILLENDGEPGRTLIDKYQIIFEDENSIKKKNVIYIVERSYNGIKNVSIAFISEQYSNINDFLEAYSSQLNSGQN